MPNTSDTKKEKHAGGRPEEYCDEDIIKSRVYRDHLPADEKVHSIEGLSDFITRSRSTIYEWCKDEDKKEFSDIVEEILSKQGKTLINKGLGNEFNASISKVMLTKHGYREGIDTDLTNKGEKFNTPFTDAILAKGSLDLREKLMNEKADDTKAA